MIPSTIYFGNYGIIVYYGHAGFLVSTVVQVLGSRFGGSAGIRAI